MGISKPISPKQSKSRNPNASLVFHKASLNIIYNDEAYLVTENEFLIIKFLHDANCNSKIGIHDECYPNQSVEVKEILKFRPTLIMKSLGVKTRFADQFRTERGGKVKKAFIKKWSRGVYSFKLADHV